MSDLEAELQKIEEAYERDRKRRSALEQELASYQWDFDEPSPEEYAAMEEAWQEEIEEKAWRDGLSPPEQLEEELGDVKDRMAQSVERQAGLSQRIAKARHRDGMPSLAAASYKDRQRATQVLRERTAQVALLLATAVVVITAGGKLGETAVPAAKRTLLWAGLALGSVAANQVLLVVGNGLVEFAQRRVARASLDAARGDWWATLARRTRTALPLLPSALAVVEVLFTGLAGWNLAYVVSESFA